MPARRANILACARQRIFNARSYNHRRISLSCTDEGNACGEIHWAGPSRRSSHSSAAQPSTSSPPVPRRRRRLRSAKMNATSRRSIYRCRPKTSCIRQHRPQPTPLNSIGRQSRSSKPIACSTKPSRNPASSIRTSSPRSKPSTLSCPPHLRRARKSSPPRRKRSSPTPTTARHSTPSNFWVASASIASACSAPAPAKSMMQKSMNAPPWRSAKISAKSA